ncbi:MAG: SIR2 family protein [Clostridiales bacterium]|jgi:hypoxanthine phosphoribosyltransferase/mannose-6-phosphate isomerase-like protein (cupin superfamily)|nr:SIR2 family protein [Clostridiales bacterium]
MRNNTEDTTIASLASNLFDRKQQNAKGYILLLGAGASLSSNCPTWAQLCAQYCNEHSLSVDDNSVDAVKKHVASRLINKIDMFASMAKHLKGKTPSIGYKHLANLVNQGYFPIILTTNFDCLLEMAISKIVELDDIKVMVRGEIPDDTIAETLGRDLPNKVNILKMHGNLTSGVFFITDNEIGTITDSLKRLLQQKAKQGCIIVGSSMQDSEINSMLNGDAVYYVNPTALSEMNGVLSILSVITTDNIRQITGKDGNFDDFFIKLDIELQKKYVTASDQKQRRKIIEKQIIDKQERGSGYINYANLTEIVNGFIGKIRSFNPDCLVFVNDPTAPGGMEVKRRLHEKFKDKHIATILVEGDPPTRTHNRCVRSSKEDLGISSSPDKILVIDSITFSGKTLELALKKIREWYPCATTKPAVLIVDEVLDEKIKNDETHSLFGIIAGKLTDRCEIFFPWGVTQATGERTRSFIGLCNSYDICVARRPWGSIEILADEKQCSVRILTIEADRSLSFQRHLCRDEFFVSIDDNIGLEICGENLDDISEYKSFSDITMIKSLVLEKGDYILIPRGIWHRFKASKERVRVLEVGYGIYDQDNDIERKEDPYGRVGSDGSV